MNILCGDIGGTKTRLAIYDPEHFPNSIVENSYPSKDFNSLAEIALNFLSGLKVSISHAAFGIAGPVSGRTCKTTNLPWEIDANLLEQELKITSIHLINDLEATAYGIAALNKSDLCILQSGSENSAGNSAVIAAGTGLGQAGMYWDGSKHTPFATEGGHCDFAPSSDVEYNLLKAIRQSNNKVCWEDILSGPRLISVYSFLLDWHNQAKPEWLNNSNSKTVAETITNSANDNLDHTAVEALKLFSSMYGTEAGNLALKHMATGGIYIGGGIAPKILKWLQQPQFLEAFCNKGKMRNLMESIPVRVILNDRAALYGSAMYLLDQVLQKQYA